MNATQQKTPGKKRIFLVLVLLVLAGGAVARYRFANKNVAVKMQTLTHAQNGSTVVVKAGERFSIVLDSTYWQFTGSEDPAIAKRLLDPAYAPKETNPAIRGTGEGTVTAHYEAVAPGSTTISAQRTTCGEALLCPPDQREFKIFLNVSR